MFDNVGNKIKILAKIVFWIEVVASFIVGIALIAVTSHLLFVSVLVWVLGPLFSYICALFIYGYGELIDGKIF